MESSILPILINLQVSNTSTIKEAQQQLQDLRKSSHIALLQALIAVISDSQANEGTQSLACVLLKQQYLDEPKEERGPELTNQEVLEMKNAISVSINFNQSTQLLNKKAQIVCKCHKKLENYSDLISQLVSLFQSGEVDESQKEKQKVYSMYMFELLSEFHLPQEEITNNAEQFITLFTNCLKEPNIKVKVATLKALTAFLESIDDESQVLKYQGIMDGILDLVIEVLRTDETSAQQSLESLIQLSETHGEIWNKVLQKLIFVISQILSNSNFEDSTRQSALEIISSLAEQMPSMLRKELESLKTHLFPSIFLMMTNVEFGDELEEWSSSQDEEIQAKKDPESVAADGLGRIASHLSEKTVVQCSMQIINEALQKQDQWKFRYAGYLYLGMISDTCKDTFKKGMVELFQKVAQGLLDQHPRVRYQAITCLGLLLNELCPDAQRKFHGDLVPVLLRMAVEEKYIKSQTQATSCLVSFVRGLSAELEDEEQEKEKEKNKDILYPYISDIVKVISHMFQLSLEQKYAPLQEEVLALLSCLANVMEEKFGEHYNTFMPGLKNILYSVTMETSQKQELRAHCIQTIGFIITGVKNKPDLCKADALEIAKNLVELLQSEKVKDSDPQLISIQTTLSDISVCLKEDFKPFLPHIMPYYLKEAQRDIDLKVQDADSLNIEKPEDETGYTSLKVQLKGFESKQLISMNTNALESKINSLEIIHNLAMNLGPAFFVYIEQVAKIIIELFDYTLSRNVRKLAVKTIKHLLKALSDSNQMTALFKLLYPSFKTAIETKLSKFDFNDLKYLMKELKDCFKQFWNFGKTGAIFLDLPEINELIKLLGNIVKVIREDKVDRLKQTQNPNFKKKMDEEDLEYLKEDIRKIDRIENHVMEISGVIVHCYKEHVDDALRNHLLKHFAETLITLKDHEDYEVHNAVCFFCDILEYGGQNLFNEIYNEAIQKFVDAIELFNEDRDMIQSAGYGIGVIGFRVPSGHLPNLTKIGAVLFQIINESDSRTDSEKQDSTENCIGALGKIIYQHYDGVNINNVAVKLFLSQLPLVSDSEEATSVHKLFFKQILNQNAALTNQDAIEETKAAYKRIREAIDSNTDLIDDEGRELMVKINFLQ